jgi:hypothetical protein
VLDEDDLPGDFLDGDFEWADDESLTCPVASPVPSRATEDDVFEEVDGSTPFPRRGRPEPFRLQPSVVIFNPLDADVDALFERSWR